MEPHKTLNIDQLEYWKPDHTAGPQLYFNKAYQFVLEFYSEELQQFSEIRFEEINPDRYFLEYIWVVHATGFSAKQVGKMMARLIPAYGHWSVLSKKESNEALEPVLRVCNNPQKAKAIWMNSKLLQDGIDVFGWDKYKSDYLSQPELLQKLPYIGKITCYHLARNIGLLEFVKPDLHLVRLAKYWNIADPITMCRNVRPEGMPLGIVDLIFWYSASHFGTLAIRESGAR